MMTLPWRKPQESFVFLSRCPCERSISVVFNMRRHGGEHVHGRHDIDLEIKRIQIDRDRTWHSTMANSKLMAGDASAFSYI